MTVTLNIGNRDIRLVSQRANHIDKYVYFSVPPGMIKDGLIMDMPAAAALLKEQFRVLTIPSGQVDVCLSGLSFVYRILTLPVFKDLKLRTAIEKATQKEINLPIEALYLDWQIISRNENEIQILVVGIARPVVDALLNTLKLAGLRLKTLELKALALICAAGHLNALIVDCEPDAFEILVISDGIPVTIHRTSPKNEMSTLNDNLNQLIAEINRTIDYHNLNHHERQLTQRTPVMLSGSLCDDPPTRELIVASIGHSVEFFTPQITVPTDFPVSSFAANLGLLYQSRSGSNHQPAVFGHRAERRVGFLQARKRALSRPVNIKQLLVTSAIIGALILFIPVWILRLQALNESTNLKMKADNLSLELVTANQKLQQDVLVQNKIAELTRQTETLKKERLMMTGNGDLALILRTINYHLPLGAVLTNLSVKPEKIVLEGTVQNRTEVIQYIRNLEKQEVFSEVRIAYIDAGADTENAGIIFRIIIER